MASRIIPQWLDGLFEKNGTCWNWSGRKESKSGYGRVSHDGRDWPAHRWVYCRYHGVELTRWQLVLHTCDNPPCVNPEHLYVGTSKRNSLDMVERDRSTYGHRNGVAKFGAREAKEIVRLYGELNQVQLAKKFGVWQSVISSILIGRTWSRVTGIKYKKLGVGQARQIVNKRRIRGARHHSTPLTARDVRRIRARYEDGDSYRQLGVEYGISAVAIANIVRRKSWRHIL